MSEELQGENLAGIEAFAETERLIVVAAHPDDLETLCGGTVTLLAQRGVTIFSANCTLGDIGAQDPNLARPALASTRLAEADEAARILGISQTFNLGHHDGELVPDLNLRAQIARLFRVTQADTLWTFDPYWTGQIHPDHRAAGQAALDAYMPSKMPLYRPEQLNEPEADLGRLERVFLFSTDRQPDIFVDVGEVYETKMAACMAHRSQFPKGAESLEWMKEIDGRQGERIDVAYAESFKQVTVW
ncbi:MAG: PIG-L family deacetylase [Chloroflexota bacterium]|nr:MAG: PIG-L family deacetylase [Chloroflexota bacterium]